MENYLQILAESLQKKLTVLEQIEEQNKEQESILQEQEVSMDAFEATVDRKSELIEALNKLDEGFEILYEKLREQLLEHREQYKEQIRRLQQLVTAVTEKGVAVQTQELRNKRLVESYFKKEKEGVRRGRISSRAALDYYRNVNQVNHIDPQFMDKKK